MESPAPLYQRVVATASNPGPLVGGLEVDVNDALASDVGQWNLHPSTAPQVSCVGLLGLKKLWPSATAESPSHSGDSWVTGGDGSSQL